MNKKGGERTKRRLKPRRPSDATGNESQKHTQTKRRRKKENPLQKKKETNHARETPRPAAKKKPLKESSLEKKKGGCK